MNNTVLDNTQNKMWQAYTFMGEKKTNKNKIWLFELSLFEIYNSSLPPYKNRVGADFL